jgi:hypothetical protein
VLTGRHPVLLYSPGTTDPRTLGTSLATDLASRGYVVVTMDHPGETTEVDIALGVHGLRLDRTAVAGRGPDDPGAA